MHLQVGAGTYVFRLDEDHCVDATASGNMAHLLNHSCQPNCISRTVPVTHPENGEVSEHVVIYAKVRGQGSGGQSYLCHVRNYER